MTLGRKSGASSESPFDSEHSVVDSLMTYQSKEAHINHQIHDTYLNNPQIHAMRAMLPCANIADNLACVG